MEILGLIPARGGSKGIPQKNIALLCGKPLLAYTCEAASLSKSLTRVVLSTNDPSIAEVGERYGAYIPCLRPEELANDDTPILPVILHMLDFLEKKENDKPEIIVLLQPTSPLRKAHHIDQAVKLLQESNADSVVSIVEVPHHYNPVSLMRLENEKFIPYEHGPEILRRQDKPKLFARNGPAVLAVWRKTLMKKKSLYGDDIRGLTMRPEESIDIDTSFDLFIAESILRNKYSA